MLQKIQSRAIALVAVVLLTACGASQASVAVLRPVVAVVASSQPLGAPAQPCTNQFVAHELDHRTTVADQPIGQSAGNGAGVAIGDLNDDGRPEIVLANLDGPNTILWNQGQLRFRTERLHEGASRAVAVVDVDADNRLDIVFTRRRGAPLYLHNVDGTHFAPGFLDINVPVYSMNWGDLDGRGALDFVGATYDAELERVQGPQFFANHDSGVYLYHHRASGFVPERLSNASQALAITLLDVNNDQRPDITVGNDFAMRDATWAHTDAGWQAATPFATTSENTMSFDQGDIDNSGRFALFSTDMKPYDKSLRNLARWLPMMKKMELPLTSNDPQLTENVLQVPDADGAYRNGGYDRVIDATGWSWSGKFGDLDNDGYLDLYVVNGMIAHGLFSHLPHDELVEQNQVFRNTGAGRFEPAPQWNLGATASGRGMSMADLDGDGDLDIVVNNVQSPALVFENRLCGGSGVEVDLRWPHQNTRAIGAHVALVTSAGTYTRDVRAMSGYLSGDTAQVHFGVPGGAIVQRLDISWPDQRVSTVEQVATHTRVTVTR